MGLSTDARGLEVVGLPPHVAAWSVARIPGFVASALERWEREHGTLPGQFSLALCPQAEVNALGGLPEGLHALTDPRLRCRHFTGCHRPYLVILFTGEQAEARRSAAQALLPWSEGYRVSVGPGRVRLEFAEASEALDLGEDREAPRRRLRELLASGELLRILE
jgi:hypothetical protein